MTKEGIVKRLKEGYKKLTPLDHARAKKSGHLWAVIGGILATAVTTYNGSWHWGIFLLAITWLQYVELRKEKQRIDGIIKMQEMVAAQNKIGTIGL